MFIHPEASIRWFYFEKSQENSCGGFSVLIKVQTPLHVFSCEFCEIKNIYFVEKLRTAASEHRIYIFFFVLILRQNRYLPLNSDHLLGKQRTMLRYRSQPSNISYLRFGDVFYFLPSNNNFAAFTESIKPDVIFFNKDNDGSGNCCKSNLGDCHYV